jgi:hypothetical protein
MDYLQSFATKTKHVMQFTRASNAVRRADEQEVQSNVKLLQLDQEIQRIDETLDRLRARGALME